MMNQHRWILRILLVVAALLVASAASAANTITVKNLKILVVVYRGPTEGNGPRLDDASYQGCVNAVELGRLFYFRNSRAELNLELHFYPIDTLAPDTAGPSYDHIAEDLRQRGIRDNQYDGIFTTGHGLAGNWGGFQILGETAAAMGGGGMGGALGTYPGTDLTVGYDWGWTFIHEYQHALDLVTCGLSDHPDMLHAHPYTDQMTNPTAIENPGGQHWDWIACTLRNFKAYNELRGTTNSFLTVTDADGDGMPDDDLRLPMDEKRFGSDATKKDTDGDGLADLAEFIAGIYDGTDPTNRDTDGDGMPDGQDRHPLLDMAETLPYAAKKPRLDGHPDDGLYGPILAGAYVSADPDMTAVEVMGAWDEQMLYLYFTGSKPFEVDLMVDTSAENGFWCGGDTYLVRIDRSGKVLFSGLGLQGEVPGAKAVMSPASGQNEVARFGCELFIPGVIGQGASREINYGGRRLPEDIADGLVLLDGRRVSFNVIYTSQDSRKRTLLTPNWRMYDLALDKKDTDPDLPMLRYSVATTRSPSPSLVVQGVGPRTTVAIVNDKGATLGTRTGPGEVKLSGVTVGHDVHTGKNVLFAKTSTGRQSAPFTLVVDTRALAPQIEAITETGAVVIKAGGEPRAVVDVAIGEGREAILFSSIDLDGDGKGALRLDPSFAGLVGTYFENNRFERPHRFRRVDKEVNYDLQWRAPDPRVGGDQFSIRWEGYLNIKRDGDYTFFLTTDDGSRLYLNGELLIDHWGHHGAEEKSATIRLTAGVHPIRLDYYEDDGYASAHLEWSGPGIERTHALPVTVVRLGPLPLTFVTISAVQRDPLGNVSAWAKPTVVRLPR